MHTHTRTHTHTHTHVESNIEHVLHSHIHEYGHVRNRHIMFITIEDRNLEIRKHLTSYSGTKPFY